MKEQNLYISPNMANKIKEYAKFKDISLKTLLEDLQLGSNTFSHMKHGRMIAADSLAKIADYLDCSVDYLLGRTDDPAISSRSDTTLTLTAHEQEIVAAYRSHPEAQPAVDRILGVTDDNHVLIYEAAKSADNHPPRIVKMSKENWEALQNAPETDEDLL